MLNLSVQSKYYGTRNYDEKRNYVKRQNVRLYLRRRRGYSDAAMPDENGVSCFAISFKWEKSCFPKKISLEWDIPAINVYYMWDALEKERSRLLCQGNAVARGVRHAA